MRLGNTLTCRHPETHKRYNFDPGTELPDWVEKMLEGRTDLKVMPEPEAAKKAPAKKKASSDGES